MSEQALQQNKMFSAVLPAKEWLRVFNLLKAVHDEFWMTASKEGVKFKTIEPAHTAMAVVNYPASAFAYYDVGEGGLETGISLDRVKDALKHISASSKEDPLVAIDVEDKRLVLSLFGGNGKNNRFRLNAMTDFKPVVPEVPDEKLGLDTAFEIEPPTLDSVLNDAKAANVDYLDITVRENLYPSTSQAIKTLWVNGEDYDKHHFYHAEIEENSTAAYFKALYKGNSVDNTRYSVDWLSLVVRSVLDTFKATANEKAKKDYTAPVLTVKFANKKPMKIELPPISTGGQLWFYLAPRVA